MGATAAERVGLADHGALTAAVAVARAHGLPVTDPVILRDHLNVHVHLRPAPVVARVAGTIARVRRGTTWQRRAIAVAAHLARAGGERAEAALAASGIRIDPGELGLWVEARSLQLAVWRAFLATS